MERTSSRATLGPGRPRPGARRTRWGDPKRVVPASVLDAVNLSATIDREDYRRALAKEQARMHRLSRRARRKGIPAAIVFQGWDAAGKGGAIRRLIAPMDARHYRVHAIGAPSDEERARHYLWRFWRRIPARGRIAIFEEHRE